MNYSCGYFKTENDTLYEAQVNKTDYILKKLALEEGHEPSGCGLRMGISANQGGQGIRCQGNRHHSQYGAV